MRPNSSADPTRAWPRERRVELWASALKRAAVRLGYGSFPQLAADALAMDAAPLRSAGIPQFFSRDLREIAPSLNEDLLDLYGRSDQAAANQFAFFNQSESLTADFDWEMHESPGWRRELHSFDYALDLAMTYRISQEDHYALHLRYLVAHWIAENPVGTGTGWEIEPLARRVRNWMLAADLARDNWTRDAEFLELFSQSFALQCIYLQQRVAKPHSPALAAHAARALLLAARYFTGAGAGSLEEAGRAILAHAARAALGEDEAAAPPRPVDVLAVAEACVENLALQPSAETVHREMDIQITRRLLTTLEGTLLPDGTLPLFGPSASSRVDELSDLFAVAAALLEVPAWKTLAGKFGIAPYLLLGEGGKRRFEQIPEEPWSAESRTVSELTLCRLDAGGRSGMAINVRPVSSARDHEDFLSYELIHRGHRAVVDSGAYSPAGETWDRYFAGARAHNVLMIDGRSSRPEVSHSLRLSDASWTSSNQRICFHDDGFASLGIQHVRAFHTLSKDTWAVLDWLEGKGRHRISNLLHFFPTFEVETRQERAIIRSRALSMTIIPLGVVTNSGPPAVALTTSRGPHPEVPGYFSPDIGIKFPAAVLALETKEASLPWFGGYLIVPGTEASFRAGEILPTEGSIEFELQGQAYRLTVL